MVESDEFTRLRTALGTRLRELRDARGWTQEVAADRAGITTRHLQRLEQGTLDARLSTILKVAQAYDTTPSELLSKGLLPR